MKPLSIALCPGIGDSLWALTKVPALLKAEGADKTHLTVCTGPGSEPSDRAVPFLIRFPFVSGVSCDREYAIPCGLDKSGCYIYTNSGRGFHHLYDWMLQANHYLERGTRLEEWMPELDTDWGIMEKFQFDDEDRRIADKMEEEAERPYVCFFTGSEVGNTVEGHNRGPMWTPEDWVALERGFYSRGFAVVLVGAMYDRGYCEKYLRAAGFRGLERNGVWPISGTLAVLKRAKCVISYQSGIGITSVFMGVPTAMWWAPKGHSQHHERFINFEESMAHCWSPPGSVESGRYLPQIYTRSTPQGILEHADKHWLGVT